MKMADYLNYFQGYISHTCFSAQALPCCLCFMHFHSRLLNALAFSTRSCSTSFYFFFLKYILYYLQSHIYVECPQFFINASIPVVYVPVYPKSCVSELYKESRLAIDEFFS